MMKRIFQISLILAVILCSRAEDVHWGKCENYVQKNCNVTRVSVTPCAEAANNKPCVIKRGRTASIEFDYQADGSFKDLETRAYWATPAGDLPWIGMDTDGCSHTLCPTTSAPEKFTYQLRIGSKYPARQYDVKWRLWKDEEMDCCFMIKIKIVK